MAAAIIPLSLDDEVVSDAAANAACISFPWLFAFGWCTAFGALFAKTRRVVRRRTPQNTYYLCISVLSHLVHFSLNIAI